ncbi:MAG: alpha/beta hydrolase [Lawsonibacter sp.]|nr:alpha/beta hydrolase [Lawsonibacter sp.]
MESISVPDHETASRLSAACGAPVEVYSVEQARGAVIICPGGGYMWRSPREGAPVARAMNGLGLYAFVLQYACEPTPLGNQPLRTLARAVAVVRAHAAKLGFPADRIAVCGFSAGGHLAASLGVFWQNAEHFDPGADLNAHRPDALILAYPVITAGTFAHRGCMNRLAGADCAGQAAWSLEQYVTHQTPPAFLWHTAEDRDVPCQNSLLFTQALVQAGVACELHLYPHGVHGLSLATPEVEEPEKGRIADAHVASWVGQLQAWLDNLWGV